MIKECKYCKEQIEFEKGYQLGAHVRNCSDNPNKISLDNKRKVIKKTYEFECKKCNELYTLELTDNLYTKQQYSKYCCRTCANSRIISQEQKDRTSQTLKSKYIKLITPSNTSTSYKLGKLCCQVFFINCKYCDNLFTTRKRDKKFCNKKCVNSFYKNQSIKIDQTKRTINKNNNFDSNKITYIYALLDEFNNIRYIGKSDNIQNRLKGHIKEAKLKRTHKEKWINSMIKQNLSPELLILEECIYPLWQFFESHWISLAKS